MLGVNVEEWLDGVIIYGGLIGSGMIDSYGDYCIVMSFVVVGLIV